MSSLVIVESPTKARTLSRFLGKDYHIEATMGHVRDLPEKKLGIEIRIQNSDIGIQKDDEKLKLKNLPEKFAIELSNNRAIEYQFIPQYQVISARKTRVAELKKLAQENSPVILATDPDRE